MTTMDARVDPEVQRALEIRDEVIAAMIASVIYSPDDFRYLCVSISDEAIARLPLRTESLKKVGFLKGIKVIREEAGGDRYSIMAVAQDGEITMHVIYLSDLINIINKGIIVPFVKGDSVATDEIPF